MLSNIETPSPWWQNLREILSKSTNLEQACCAALVVRSIMAEFEKQKISRVIIVFLDATFLTPSKSQEINFFLMVARCLKRGQMIRTWLYWTTL